MPTTAGIWTESFPVRAYEVTPAGTASVLAVADYLQEAAGHHAAVLGVSMQDLLAEDRAWVLARLRMELDRLPAWEETVTLETWPSGLERLYATREFVLTGDDGPIGHATSAWLVIDTERRRPLRPPADLRTLQTPDRPAPLTLDWDDLPAPTAPDRTRTFAVRYHDLDLNRHVNNVRYLEWALETLPERLLDGPGCSAVELQFHAETTLGDSVHAAAQLHPTGSATTVHHALTHADTGEALATVVTEWGARNE